MKSDKTEPASCPPLLPRMAFRVGITGARPNKLDPAAMPALRAHLDTVLRLVRTTIEGVAGDADVRGAYRPGLPLCRLLSPLAEGSDRIAAEMALEAGFRLEVPMPFPIAEYEKTFGSEPEQRPPGAGDALKTLPFGTLLAAARTEEGATATLALDGSRTEDAEAGYRAVGRFVVRNCDLLIAIWDGKPGRPGGTAEIVRYAARSHVPVWWIEAGGAAPPRLLLGAADFERREAAAQGEAAEKALVALMRQALVPPEVGEPDHHTWLGWCMSRVASRFGHGRESLAGYLAEREERVRPTLWRAYEWALRLVVLGLRAVDPHGRGLAAGGPPVGDAVEAEWAAMHAAAGGHGSKYADRYRSAYVLIIALAAVAVVAMGAALAFPRRLGLAATGIELLALVGILLVVGASELWRWHERWIAYRLLAELCRKQRMLARLGWSLPVAQVAELAGEPDRERAPRDAWVAWYFAAVLRGAALPHGAIGDHVARARFLGQAMVGEQRTYHQRRRVVSGTAARRLIRLGEAFFGLTLALALVKFTLLLGGERPGTAGWLGFGCVTLAALSAGFVSIRAYAEFDLLTLQSEQMLRVLAETDEELAAVDPGQALAAQSLGAVLHALAIAMLHDVQGWSLLFRTKTPETG